MQAQDVLPRRPELASFEPRVFLYGVTGGLYAAALRLVESRASPRRE